MNNKFEIGDTVVYFSDRDNKFDDFNYKRGKVVAITPNYYEVHFDEIGPCNPEKPERGWSCYEYELRKV